MYSTDSKLWSFRFRSSNVFVIGVVCLGLFTETLTFCTIIPILPPALISRANIPESYVQYYISTLLASYAITYFISAPIFGYLVDRLASRRQPFLAGILAAIISLILFMRADSFVGMTIARALQGISSAAVNIVGMALIKDTLSKERIGAGMAYSNAAVQSGLVLGPSVGGLLYDHLGYDAVFIIPAVLLGIDFLMRLIMIEKSGHPKQASADDQGNRKSSESAQGSDTDAANDASTEDTPLLKSPPTYQAGIRRFAVIDLILCSRMITTLLVGTTNMIIWTGLESTIPLFVLRTFDWKASQSGLLFFASCIPGIMLSSLAGRAIDRLGSLWPTAIGVMIQAICFITQRVVRQNTLHDKITHVTLFTIGNISGLFVAIANAAEIGLIAHEADLEREKAGKKGGTVGKGYALSTMACSGGQFLGPLIGGFMIEKTGWPGLTLLYGCLWIASLPAILAFTGGGIAGFVRGKTNSQEEDLSEQSQNVC